MTTKVVVTTTPTHAAEVTIVTGHGDDAKEETQKVEVNSSSTFYVHSNCSLLIAELADDDTDNDTSIVDESGE